MTHLLADRLRLFAGRLIVLTLQAAQDEPLVVKYLSAVLHRSVPDTSSFTIPEEVPPYADYPEGGITRVTVNRFERSRAARKQCLQHMGYRCIVCKMSFGERYGSEVEGYTHVHHLVPQAQMRKRYVLKPEHDLVPVCPNCHAVLHAGGITRTIEAVQEMLRLAKARTEKGDAEA